MYLIREIERGDIPVINRWRNNPELVAMLGATFAYVNPDVDLAWYESYLKRRDSDVRCAIVRRDEGDRLIGVVYLLHIDRVNRSAELGIMIGDKADRGRGAGTFAMREILKHAFMDLNLFRVELSVPGENAVARRLYEKCGFQVEGTRRKARYKQGRYHDMILMSILKEEWGGRP